MEKIIDGRKINREVGERLKKEIEQKGIHPSLGILCVGNDKASLSFIESKKKFGERYGFMVNLYKLSQDVSKEEIISEIKKIEGENNSIIVQLPLPEKFKDETDEILSHINVKKDVDNLTGKNYFESPIVLSLQKVLEFVPEIKKVAIVGMGKVVGQPIKSYLERINIDYMEIGKGGFSSMYDCDVVIGGVGIPHLIPASCIKKGSTLIDYGCSYKGDTLCGDFDPSCYDEAKLYTPVPGGMGPVVIASLFENVIAGV